MAEDREKMPEVDLLPMGQRIAWMAGIWALSAGAMVLLTYAIRSLIG